MIQGASSIFEQNNFNAIFSECVLIICSINVIREEQKEHDIVKPENQLDKLYDALQNCLQCLDRITAYFNGTRDYGILDFCGQLRRINKSLIKLSHKNIDQLEKSFQNEHLPSLSLNIQEFIKWLQKLITSPGQPPETNALKSIINPLIIDPTLETILSTKNNLLTLFTSLSEKFKPTTEKPMTVELEDLTKSFKEKL